MIFLSLLAVSSPFMTCDVATRRDRKRYKTLKSISHSIFNYLQCPHTPPPTAPLPVCSRKWNVRYLDRLIYYMYFISAPVSLLL